MGYGTWSEVSYFDLKCQMTLFANDKIRIIWFLPMDGSAKATFINDNPDEAEPSGGKLSMDESELGQMRFIRSNSFRQYIVTTFDKELFGL